MDHCPDQPDAETGRKHEGEREVFQVQRRMAPMLAQSLVSKSKGILYILHHFLAVLYPSWNSME